MRVKTVYLGLVRSRIGKTEEQYEVAESSSLADLIHNLERDYGEKLHPLLGSRNESRLDPTLITTVNGALKDPSRWSSVTLKDGDVVTFMTLISGG